MTQRYRNFCFTWNNYPEDCDDFLEKARDDHNITYMIYGFETAPTTGTPHLQGYFEMKNAKTESALRKKLPGIHITVAKGDALQNRDYCGKGQQSKEEWEKLGANGPNYGLNAAVNEYGTAKEQGKRNDIETAMRLIKEGKSDLELFEQCPGVAFKYPKGCEKYRLLLEKKDNKWKKKDIRIYWGTTRTGKTRSAMDEFPDACRLCSGNTGLWFTGFDGEKQVIIDEFRGQIPIGQLLNYTDGYPCVVPLHGSQRRFHPDVIIFTSNVNPKEWYPNCDTASRDAFFARVTEIKVFGNPEGEEPPKKDFSGIARKAKEEDEEEI